MREYGYVGPLGIITFVLVLLIFLRVFGIL
jgi:hypothetical protein